MNATHTDSAAVVAAFDPDSYVWLKYTGPRAKLTLKSGDVVTLNKGDLFGLKGTGNVYHFHAVLDDKNYSFKMSPEFYATLSSRGVLVKKRGMDLEGLQKRLNRCQKEYVVRLIKVAAHVNFRNAPVSVPALKVMANNLYALLHAYGVVLRRVKTTKVSDTVIHDPLVARLIQFLFDEADLDSLPKTRINGYEMCSVPTPRLKDATVTKEAQELFLLARRRLLVVLKTRLPALTKALVLSGSSDALHKCTELAKDGVLLCSVMAELLAGNMPQAKFNARGLRSVQLA